MSRDLIRVEALALGTADWGDFNRSTIPDLWVMFEPWTLKRHIYLTSDELERHDDDEANAKLTLCLRIVLNFHVYELLQK